MSDMMRHENTRRSDAPPDPETRRKNVPITPEELIYLSGGPPPEVQWKLKYESNPK